MQDTDGGKYFPIANEALSLVHMENSQLLNSDEDSAVAYSNAIQLTKAAIRYYATIYNDWKFCINSRIFRPINDAPRVDIAEFAAVSESDNIFKMPLRYLELVNVYSVNEDNTKKEILVYGEDYNVVRLGEVFFVSSEAKILVTYYVDPAPISLPPLFKKLVVEQVAYDLISFDTNISESSKYRHRTDIDKFRQESIRKNNEIGQPVRRLR